LTVVDGQNARRGFRIVPTEEATISIQGLTVQNGLSNVAVPSEQGHFMGGGMICRADNKGPLVFVTLSLSNVVFSNNVVQGTGNATAGGGGAAFYYQCRTTLENVVFDSNQVTGGVAPDSTRGAQVLGGGFFATGNSDIVATDITLTDNTIQAGSGGVGQDGDGERADGLGGGAAMQYNTVTITGITATGNQAIAGDGSQYGGYGTGGALFFEKNTGTVTVTDGTLSGNNATGGAGTSDQGGEGGGGAIRSQDSTLHLERLNIVNNSAIGGANTNDAGDGSGGALYFSRGSDPWGYPSTVTGINLVIADNVAEAGEGGQRWGGGGGIFCQNTDLTLTHATIAGNSVLSTMAAPAIIVLHYDGSGIWGSRARLYYSIIANHTTASWGPAAMAQRSGDTLELNYTLFNGNSNNYGAWPSETPTVSNNNEITPSGDPAFVSLGSPNYDYHIGGSSAARDKATGSTTSLDIDKESRPSGSAADVGADEYVPMNAELVLFKSYAPSNIAATGSPQVVPVLHKITLRNTGMGNTTSATLADVLSTPASPLGMTFATGPNCSSGTVCNHIAGTVNWSGNLDAGSAVTITYTTNVNVPAGYAETTAITTTTSYAYTDEEGGSGTGTIVPAFFVNGRLIYLPLVLR